MELKVTQSKAPFKWHYLNRNAGRDVHPGPKNGFDFVREVPNSHREKQKEALNDISSSQKTCAWAERVHKQLSVPSGSWIFPTGKQKAMPWPTQEANTPNIRSFNALRLQKPSYNYTHPQRFQDQKPTASTPNETEQVGVLLGPSWASFCYLWWSMLYRLWSTKILQRWNQINNIPIELLIRSKKKSHHQLCILFLPK